MLYTDLTPAPDPAVTAPEPAPSPGRRPGKHDRESLATLKRGLPG